jgi:hypothetical protein
MKKTTVELIEKTFKRNFDDITYEIHKNKKEIKRLAEKQRELKNMRKDLFDILSQIRGYK